MPLVQDVVEGFRPLADSKRMAVDVTSTATDLVVHGSPDSLRQVLLNLLDNAVKFGPAGQTVAVGVELAGDQARISVADGGPGVPASERARIFRAFERGRETRGTGGAGIGLAVVRQIVEAHGGSVSIEPNPGGGARFVVTLPLPGRAE